MSLLSESQTEPGSRAKRVSAADPTVRFKRHLDQVARDTEKLLERLLAPHSVAGEKMRPPRLLDAMRYASLGGGKRLRPFLVVESASLFGTPRRQALMVAVALECVHCYSLVHDDLPAMDNDALRRGRPTVHKAFDEATAILAGDSLLTFAFDVLSRPQTHQDPALRVKLVSALSRAAGIGGMAGGQMLDLAAEGRYARPDLDFDDIRNLQAMKTGALLQFACSSGAILGGADRKELSALERYGAAVGEAFQIADDLLDVEGDATTLGKATRKDTAAHKATFVSLLGVDGARQRLNTLVRKAEKAISPFGKNAGVLKVAANFIANRRS
ncbi:MAG TPA: farnesyl diphosphate synthase [Pseudolabrys sp.]|jgi:farnesyl diphosphate synthase|nr:farnesyl diphosphate synthase [Pseudolabrys sp.]